DPVGGHQRFHETPVVAAHDPDDLRLARRQLLQRCGQRVDALVELPPGQATQLVDQAGAVRAALRCTGETYGDAHAFAAHGRGDFQVAVGPHRRHQLGAAHGADQTESLVDATCHGSAQDREAAQGAELFEGLLHHRAHVLVDLVDVRVLAELCGDVDRL